MENRRIDVELRQIVEEGKRVMRTRGSDAASAYLIRYSVPLPLITRLLDELRARGGA